MYRTKALPIKPAPPVTRIFWIAPSIKKLQVWDSLRQKLLPLVVIPDSVEYFLRTSPPVHDRSAVPAEFGEGNLLQRFMDLYTKLALTVFDRPGSASHSLYWEQIGCQSGEVDGGESSPNYDVSVLLVEY